MEPGMVSQLGQLLYDAERERRPLEPLSRTHPGLSPADAYAIQEAYAALRLGAGARLAGRKIGCTSKAMQEQFDIDTPDYGHIFNDMLVADGGTVPADSLIQPLVEPELAFVLSEPLEGPDATAEDVLAITRGIAPCLEIIDSRIRDWEIVFVDTVADNGSSARCVLGPLVTDFGQADLRDEPASLFRNGELTASATAAAVLGHPANAVAWLANALAAFGRKLGAGEYVLSGSITSAVRASRGDTFEARFGRFGVVSCSFG